MWRTNGSFAVADAPNGRERIQLFDATGVRTGGFLLPGRGAARIVLGSLSLNGVGTLTFTGRTLVMSHPESGWLLERVRAWPARRFDRSDDFARPATRPIASCTSR